MPFDNPASPPAEVKPSREVEILQQMLTIPWCQDTLKTGDKMCLIGSLSYAANSRDARLPLSCWPNAARRVRARLAKLAHTTLGSLEEWNDDPERTEEDVRNLVRLAIETF